MADKWLSSNEMINMPANLSPSDQARASFANEGLRFPPVPEPLSEQLQAVNEHLFATTELPSTAYGLDLFINQVIANEAPKDYVVIGFDGHGINSWAAHYYLVQGPLALFVQLHWGGAYTDTDNARQLIDAVFQRAETLQKTMEQATSLGRIPEGWRLLIVISSFSQPGWTWVPSPPPNADQLHWQQPPHLLTEVAAMLNDLVNGKTSLN